MNPCPLATAAVLLVFSTRLALAWGPHPTITQAALDTLGTNHPLKLLLGQQAQRLTNFCLLADFKRLPFRDVDQDFYADDYLLFPGITNHLDHICPEVRRAYAPYFKRALQAMRTESPANAARWIGSLLHFVEDSGSPPHAAEIRGPTHLKMENWVNAAQIQIPGYQPRALGTDDPTALEGLEKRMKELIDFSRPRGQRLTTPVLLGNRKTVESVSLECALETSRVTADLLHTLGLLAKTNVDGGGAVLGRVQFKAAPRYERVPARVVIPGTPYATLTDDDGRFTFRNLPAGTYQTFAFAAGCQTTNRPVVVRSGAETEWEVTLASGGSLVRNGDFAIHWIQRDAPDCWYSTSQAWEGEVIALQAGRRYRLRVDFQPGTTGSVMVRWSREVPYDLPQNVKVPHIEAKPIRPGDPEMVFTASEAMGLLQVSIRTGRPESVCRRIQLEMEKE